jgi:4-hydroxybenzoate polyprenyltransferase
MSRVEAGPVAHPASLLSRRGPAPAAFFALRPRQWAKNLVLFAGLLFAEQFNHPLAWVRAATLFWAYCAVSSSAYLLNDVRDRQSDRLHPSKRHRPVASGELSPAAALAGAAGLLAGGIGVGVLLGGRTVVYLIIFVSLQAAYSCGLKRLVGVDVLVIAGLFVLRAAAGAAVVGVHISHWLLTCTALLALFLALSKRRSELALVALKRTPGRPVLSRYSNAVLVPLTLLLAGAAGLAYVVYALVGPDSPEMAATIPFVWIGIGRYVFLVHRHDLGEEPDELLFTDRVMSLAVCGFAVSAVAVLAAF